MAWPGLAISVSPDHRGSFVSVKASTRPTCGQFSSTSIISEMAVRGQNSQTSAVDSRRQSQRRVSSAQDGVGTRNFVWFPLSMWHRFGPRRKVVTKHR
jgi:hypothetical protein